MRVTGPASGPDERFIRTRDSIAVLGQIGHAIPGEDLDDFIERSERSLAIAPVLHPSEYRLAAPNLEQLVRLAKAARDFRRVVETLVLTEPPPPAQPAASLPEAA